MGQADFSHGNPVMEDYVATANIAAGDVVVVGDRPMIAHTAIADTKLGALAGGGGVYKVAGDAAIAIGKKVWWNDTANQVTETRSTHKVFGYIAANGAISGAAAYGYAVHAPGIDQII